MTDTDEESAGWIARNVPKLTEHLQGYPYSQDVITRLHERAESYRQSSPSAAHTADLLDEAAGCISALLADLHAYQMTMERIAEADPLT